MRTMPMRSTPITTTRCLLVLVLVGGAWPDVDAAGADDSGLRSEYGVEPTAEGTIAFLRSLRPDPALREKVRDWVRQLGDASFAVREAATRALLELPVVPMDELRAAADSADSETSIRAKRILEHPKTIAKLQSAVRQRGRTAAVLRTIGERSIGGTTVALLESAPLLEDSELVDLAADAAAKVARAEELPAIRDVLDEDNVAARTIAVRALGKAGGRAVVDELKALSSEENPRLRLAVGHAMAEQAEQSCLGVLVGLIEVENVAVRARAEQILRAATGENFGFNPFGTLDGQEDAVERWKAWLAERGDAVKLRAPLVLAALPEDLTTGLIVHYSFDADADGRLEDSSGHGRHGRTNNAVAFIARGEGRAVQFAGMGHHGAGGGHATLPPVDFAKLEAFSLAMWVRETGMTHGEGEAYITYGVDRGVGTEDALGIAHFNASLIFRVGDGQIDLPYKATDRGRWVHYAMTFADGRLRAYKDANALGETKARVNAPSGQAALARHWWAEGAGTSARFQGAMDEVRIYDRALSGEQVRLLMEATD